MKMGGFEVNEAKLRAERLHSYLELQIGFFKGRIPLSFMSLIVLSPKEILDSSRKPLLCMRMNPIAFEVRLTHCPSPLCSAGHRVCLGEHLARTELFIFFANLLRAFTFQLPEGVTKINTEPILGGTLQPHPYRICAIPR